MEMVFSSQKDKIVKHICIWFVFIWILKVFTYPRLFYLDVLLVSLLFISFILKMRLIFMKKPILLIDESGIKEEVSGLGGSQILWNEIESITYEDSFFGKKLIIHFKDIKSYISRQSLFKRLIWAVRCKMTRSQAFDINIEYLSESPIELYQKVNHYKQNYVFE